MSENCDWLLLSAFLSRCEFSLELCEKMWMYLKYFLFICRKYGGSFYNKKNLNCNIPRVKLQSINVCKYKKLSRQKPRIVKSEVLEHKKIKLIRKHSHMQEKLTITSEENNLSSKKT